MSEQLQIGTRIWAAAGGDGARCGLFGGELEIEPRPTRRLAAAGACAAPVVFDAAGTAFVADLAGGVQAFGPEGAPRWRVALTGGISAAPVVASGQARLFAATHAGRVYALDTAAGTSVWEREIPTRSDPRVLTDLLLVAEASAVVLSSWGGRFVMLDAETGAERAAWDAGIAPRAAAAADRAGGIYCMRAVAGRGVEFLRVTAGGAETVLHGEPEPARGARRTIVAAAPAVDEKRGVVYFVTNGDRAARLHAWSPAGGARLWSCDLPACVEATPTVLSDGTILVADLAGSLCAVRPDGAHAWAYATGAEYLLAGAAGEAGGRAWAGDPAGALHRLDAAAGTGAACFEAARGFQGRPAFDPRGHLHLPCLDHGVYVFPPRQGA